MLGFLKIFLRLGGGGGGGIQFFSWPDFDVYCCFVLHFCDISVIIVIFIGIGVGVLINWGVGIFLKSSDWGGPNRLKWVCSSLIPPLPLQLGR